MKNEHEVKSEHAKPMKLKDFTGFLLDFLVNHDILCNSQLLAQNMHLSKTQRSSVLRNIFYSTTLLVDILR